MAEVERLAYHLEVAGIHLMRQGNSLMLRDPEGNGVLLRVGLPQNNDEVMSSAEAFPDVRATAWDEFYKILDAHSVP
jgi:hypothetical protein